jgi:hypothetical protein
MTVQEMKTPMEPLHPSRKEYRCVGGPFDGKTLRLNTTATLDFKLKGGWVGRYVKPAGSGRDNRMMWEGNNPLMAGGL